MSHVLRLELSEAEYAAIMKAAEATGKTPTDWATSRLREDLSVIEKEPAQGGIPEEVFVLLEKVAPRIGKTIEELVAKWVIDLAPKPRPELSEEEYSAADERLRRQIVDLGYATGADNESIDADLARAYGDNHEAEDQKAA